MAVLALAGLHLEETQRVAGGHLVDLALGHALEAVGEDALRVRLVRLLVGEIGGPYLALDVHVVRRLPARKEAACWLQAASVRSNLLGVAATEEQCKWAVRLHRPGHTRALSSAAAFCKVDAPRV